MGILREFITLSFFRILTIEVCIKKGKCRNVTTYIGSWGPEYENKSAKNMLLNLSFWIWLMVKIREC